MVLCRVDFQRQRRHTGRSLRQKFKDTDLALQADHEKTHAIQKFEYHLNCGGGRTTYYDDKQCWSREAWSTGKPRPSHATREGLTYISIYSYLLATLSEDIKYLIGKVYFTKHETHSLERSRAYTDADTDDSAAFTPSSRCSAMKSPQRNGCVAEVSLIVVPEEQCYINDEYSLSPNQEVSTYSNIDSAFRPASLPHPQLPEMPTVILTHVS